MNTGKLTGQGAIDLATIAKRLECSPQELEQAFQTKNPLESLTDLLETKQAGSLCVPQAPCVEACAPRQNPLPRPKGHACMGRFQAPTAPPGRDPLVLALEQIKPGAELFMMVRRADEKFDFDQAIKLPANTEKYVQADGRYNIVFDDAWCAAHDIEPGAILEIAQRMPDGSRASDGLVVAINAAGMPCTPVQNGRAGTAHRINLPPGDRIGNIQELPLFVHEADPRPVRIDPAKLSHRVEYGKIVVRGALEPFANVMAENASTGAKGDPVKVGADGSFEARVHGSENHGILLRVLDHHVPFGGAQHGAHANHERRLTGIAGTKEPLVLAENPRLGMKGPVELRLARASVVGEKLILDRGVTPGSLITVRNDSSEPVREFKTAASLGGSFVLPADLHVDDFITLTVANPFASVSSEASISIRAKVISGKKGCELSLMEDFGDAAFVKKLPRSAIDRGENVDRVTSAQPNPVSLPFSINSIQGGEMGLGVTIQSDVAASKDGRAQVSSSITFDREAKKMTMIVDYTRMGGFEKEGAPSQANSFARVVPEHNQGAYHQNFPHTVTGAWALEIQDSKGNVLGQGTIEGKRVSSSYVSSSYDGRGGILPVGSIPRGNVVTHQRTMFDVTSFQAS